MDSNRVLSKIVTLLSECIAIEYKEIQLDRFNQILDLINTIPKVAEK